MTLAVTVHHRLGDFLLDVDFSSAGRLTALFGPSGSGKSTLVNMIAGLIRPQRARIEIDGRRLVDTETGVFVPIHRRRIGYVFQDARLFPHLTVAQNLDYGRFFSPAGERGGSAATVIELLGIGHLLTRRPATLSGGERQRVAIGRALLSSPRLMLMDEPLAALDEARKTEIIPYIERLRDEAGVPIVYVSHSMSEVARLATDVVIFAAGKSVSSGPAADVLSRMDWLADGERDEAGVLIDLVAMEDDPLGLTVLRSPGGIWRLPKIDANPGTALRVRVLARDVILASEKPSAISALNVFAGEVDAIAAGSGLDSLVRVTCGGDRILARITNYSVASLNLTVGSRVYVIVKAVALADRNQPRPRP